MYRIVINVIKISETSKFWQPTNQHNTTQHNTTNQPTQHNQPTQPNTTNPTQPTNPTQHNPTQHNQPTNTTQPTNRTQPTNQPTNQPNPTHMKQSLLQKLTVPQLVKKFPPSNVTLRFITAFTRARHRSKPINNLFI
jgi:outer membrane biosynthesis protein TonB